jgi:hypothetical protein
MTAAEDQLEIPAIFPGAGRSLPMVSFPMRLLFLADIVINDVEDESVNFKSSSAVRLGNSLS